MQWIKQRERERRKTQSKYTGSFHKPEVVLFPLHFQGEFTKNVISNYNCSMLQLARDFKLLKHNCKRFPMLRNTVKRLPMLKHNCKRLLLLKHASKRLLIKQNYKEVCLSLNTWYTFSGVHNTNQIQTLKTLEFLRYEFWQEILSDFGCRTITEFGTLWIVVWVLFLCVSAYPTSRSSLLYIEVWRIRWKISSTLKSCLNLDQNHQWSFAWYGYCPMKDQFQMHP